MNPPVYLVFSGSYWITHPQEVNSISSTASSILGGPYLNGLSQYGSGLGTAHYAASVVDLNGLLNGFTPSDVPHEINR